MTIYEMYDCLRDVVGVSADALDLAFSVGGLNEDTAIKILHYHTGWGNFEGFLDYLSEE